LKRKKAISSLIPKEKIESWLEQRLSEKNKYSKKLSELQGRFAKYKLNPDLDVVEKATYAIEMCQFKEQIAYFEGKIEKLDSIISKHRYNLQKRNTTSKKMVRYCLRFNESKPLKLLFMEAYIANPNLSGKEYWQYVEDNYDRSKYPKGFVLKQNTVQTWLRKYRSLGPVGLGVRPQANKLMTYPNKYGDLIISWAGLRLKVYNITNQGHVLVTVAEFFKQKALQTGKLSKVRSRFKFSNKDLVKDMFCRKMILNTVEEKNTYRKTVRLTDAFYFQGAYYVFWDANFIKCFREDGYLKSHINDFVGYYFQDVNGKATKFNAINTAKRINRFNKAYGDETDPTKPYLCLESNDMIVNLSKSKSFMGLLYINLSLSAEGRIIKRSKNAI